MTLWKAGGHLCCVNSDRQFPVNGIQIHCQGPYQDGSGSVDLVVAEHCGVMSLMISMLVIQH